MLLPSHTQPLLKRAADDVKVSFLEETLLHVLKDIRNQADMNHILLYGTFAQDMYCGLSELVGETWLAKHGVVALSGNYDDTPTVIKQGKDYVNPHKIYKMRFDEKDLVYYR